jgi:uncharacterized membrane protein YkgB
MSFWAACVITNFFSAIPYLGTDLVEFIIPIKALSFFVTLPKNNSESPSEAGDSI